MTAPAALPPRPDDLRVVVVDMDGTFLRPDSSYDVERFAAIHERMATEGVRFVVASGNQEARLLGRFVDLVPDGVVSDNGGVVLCEGRRVLETSIGADELRAALELLAELGDPVYVASGPDGAFVRETEPQPARDALLFYHPQSELVPDTEDVIGRRVAKIALYEPDGFESAFSAALVARLHPGLVAVTSGHSSIDVIVAGRNKATGLQVLLDEWGLSPAQAAAFGDSGNDVEMLRLVGCPVAMAVASDEVIEAADFRAPGHDEDGVLQVLEAWFPQA